VEQPLVSIVCAVKNRAGSIRRCIDSVLGQQVAGLECVVQDGGSTDGTLQILQDYGSRIALESAPDRGATHAVYRAIARARGAVVGSCMSDECMLPGAANWGVSELHAHAEAGAIYGAVRTCDPAGRALGILDAGEFEYEHLLAGESMPPFPATFFRGDCVREIVAGPFIGAGDFEFWVRFASRFGVTRASGHLVSNYELSPATLSNSPTAYHAEHPARVSFLTHFLAADTPACLAQRERAIAGCHLWYAGNYLRIGDTAAAQRCVEEAWAAWPAGKPLLRADAQAIARQAALWLANARRGGAMAAGEDAPTLGPALLSHVSRPSPATLRPCLPDVAPAHGYARRRFWLAHLLRPVLDLWAPLHALELRRVLVLGAEGFGRALARDLERAGVNVLGFIENNEAIRRGSASLLPCFTSDEAARGTAADVVVSAIVGEHDRDVLADLQHRVAPLGLPVVSWKTVVGLADLGV
jgi:hypothetical protein